MPLGVTSRVSFGFWRKKSQKRKPKKSRQNGLLRRSVGNPRHGVALRCSVGCLAAARPRATPRRRHCSQRENFWILF